MVELQPEVDPGHPGRTRDGVGLHPAWSGPRGRSHTVCDTPWILEKRRRGQESPEAMSSHMGSLGGGRWSEDREKGGIEIKR